jgi:hypothetical protein
MIRLRPCFLGVLVILAQAAGPAVSSTNAADRATGGFLQIPPPWYRRVYETEGTLDRKHRVFDSLWREDLHNLRALGFDTVVVQFSVSNDAVLFDGDVRLGDRTLRPDRGDIIRWSVSSVLEQARSAGIKVWLGLRFRSDWNSKTWGSVVSDPRPVIDETLAVATGLKEAGLLETDAFAGWYITPEIGNARVVSLKSAAAAGNHALKAVCAGLRTIADRPVAISAFYRIQQPGQTRAGFLMGHLNEAEYLDLLEWTLAGTGVSHLIFQDGVGVEDAQKSPKSGLTAQELKTLQDRYRGIIARCEKMKITAWADVELFMGEEGSLPATNLPRLLDQLRAASLFPRILVFAPSHHMTLLGGAPGADSLYKELLKHIAGKR